MDTKDIDSLLSLLKDPDQDTFDAVFDSLTSDPSLIPILEDLWKKADDEISITRLECLLHRSYFNILKYELVKWKMNESSIIEGAWRVATYQYPDLTFAEVDDTINNMVKDVWIELRDDMSPPEQIAIINHVIFEKYGLHGDTENILTLDNLLINNVLRLKKGNHLALSIIYMGVAEKLNIPIFGISLPTHFILAYMKDVFPKPNAVFYIDPFDSNTILNETNIKYSLENNQIPFDPEYLFPCSDLLTIHLMVAELMTWYEHKNLKNEMEEMNELLQIFQYDT